MSDERTSVDYWCRMKKVAAHVVRLDRLPALQEVYAMEREYEMAREHAYRVRCEAHAASSAAAPVDASSEQMDDPPPPPPLPPSPQAPPPPPTPSRPAPSFDEFARYCIDV